MGVTTWDAERMHLERLREQLDSRNARILEQEKVVERERLKLYHPTQTVNESN